MKIRRITAVIMAALMAVFMCSCAGKPAEKTEKTKTIVDHAGNEVEIPEKIERIVVTDTLPFPSVLTLFLGSADKIVGMSPSSMNAAENSVLGELYPEILKADTSFFEGNQLNTESLLTLKPDIVFYNAGSTQIADAVKAAGIPAVAVSVTKWNYDAMETYVQWLKLLEDIFSDERGLSDKAGTYGEKIHSEIDAKTKDLKDTERKKVFYLFNSSDAGIITSGRKFWGQFWCDMAGAVNTGQDMPEEKSNAAVNMEQIYSWDPQVMFITNFTQITPDDIYSNNAGEYDWSTVSAVADRQVYKLPFGFYRTFTPGADTPVVMLWTAKCIYPELFEDVDIQEEVEDYYKEVYNISLTKEQISRMYK